MTPGYVYLVNAENTDLYKIGCTRRPIKTRLQELNHRQQPYPIKLIHWIKVDDERVVETRLHKQWAEFRQHNEWFVFEDYRTVINSMNEIELETFRFCLGELQTIEASIKNIRAKCPEYIKCWNTRARADGFITFEDVENYIDHILH
jgi:T5orf172 domain